jgi:hypothetical protein
VLSEPAAADGATTDGAEAPPAAEADGAALGGVEVAPEHAPTTLANAITRSAAVPPRM